MNPEVGHGTTQVYASVQSGGGEVNSGSWSDGGAYLGPDSAGPAGGWRGAGCRSNRVGRHQVLPDGRTPRRSPLGAATRLSLPRRSEAARPGPSRPGSACEPRDPVDYVRTVASPTGRGYRLVPEGAGGPELSAVRRLCGDGVSSP